MIKKKDEEPQQTESQESLYVESIEKITLRQSGTTEALNISTTF